MEPIKEDIFAFLEDLRQSGETNMFGAVPYIMEEFDLDKRTAGNWLKQWMEDFNG